MASKTRTRRPRLGRKQIETEALRNALAERSVANYEAIFEGFAEKGIPMEDVVPRENVFTYNAWRALGRQVRKGEHGVPVVTWITSKAKGGEGAEQEGQGGGEQSGESAGFKFSRTVTVFHISQTDPINPSPAPAQASAPAEAVPA